MDEWMMLLNATLAADKLIFVLSEKKLKEGI
jgi:hypothetical protein